MPIKNDLSILSSRIALHSEKCMTSVFDLQVLESYTHCRRKPMTYWKSWENTELDPYVLCKSIYLTI